MDRKSENYIISIRLTKGMINMLMWLLNWISNFQNYVWRQVGPSNNKAPVGPSNVDYYLNDECTMKIILDSTRWYDMQGK